METAILTFLSWCACDYSPNIASRRLNFPPQSRFIFKAQEYTPNALTSTEKVSQWQPDFPLEGQVQEGETRTISVELCELSKCLFLTPHE